ncbi:MAG: ABC transporter permease, partial [Albidovulum sp.]
MRASLLIGLGLSLAALSAALVSFVWTPHDTTTLAIAERLMPPSASHWLGTDHFGRDIATLLMTGARTSIAVALVAVGIGMGVGV